MVLEEPCVSCHISHGQQRKGQSTGACKIKPGNTTKILLKNFLKKKVKQKLERKEQSGDYRLGIIQRFDLICRPYLISTWILGEPENGERESVCVEQVVELTQTQSQ